MRRRVIAGNWKMFKTLADTRSFFSAFLPLVSNAKHCEIVVAPPFTASSPFRIGRRLFLSEKSID